MASLLPPVCSTSYSSACLQRCALVPRQARGSLQVCAADAFCKDKVNITKKVSVEGSATVTFLGAGGQSVSVECPKVRPPWGSVSQCAQALTQQAPEKHCAARRVTPTAAMHRTHTSWMRAWMRAWSCPTPAGAASAGVGRLCHEVAAASCSVLATSTRWQVA